MHLNDCHFRAFFCWNHERRGLAKTDKLHGMTPAVANYRPTVPDGHCRSHVISQTRAFSTLGSIQSGEAAIERVRKEKKRNESLYD